MKHYTVEEIMSMPGYCRDKYEREIHLLIRTIEEVSKRLTNAVAYMPEISQVNIPEAYLISGASIKEFRDIAEFLNKNKEEKQP